MLKEKQKQTSGERGTLLEVFFSVVNEVATNSSTGNSLQSFISLKTFREKKIRLKCQRTDNFNPQIPEPKVNQRSHMQYLSQKIGKLSLRQCLVLLKSIAKTEAMER